MKFRNIFKIVIGTIVLFIIVTYATASLEANADGADRYGFPLNFYTKSVGYDMVNQTGAASEIFSGVNLIGDVIFAFVLSFLAVKIFNKFKTNK